MEKKVPVLITTDNTKRGVFMGFIDPKDASVAHRFWSKVQHGPVDQCWPWIGGKYSNGYGRFNINGLRNGAHRLAHFLVNDDLEDSKVIHHECGNKLCCNPTHLESVTPRENTRRYYNQVTMINGEAYAR